MQADGHLLAHVIDSTPIGILILEQDTTVVFVNQYVLDLFGCAREDMVGNTLKALANRSKDEIDIESILKNLREDTLANYKITLAFESRPDMVCLLNSFSVEEIDPYPDCSALVIRDITDEQAADDLIKAKNIEIAKKNTDLVRSVAELKKVSDLKSNFLSIASHELNTPLTSIKGYSDIIIDNMREKVDPSVFRMIESINRAADRLHKVVNNILDVTKIEQGRLRLRPEQADLGAIMRDCVEELSQIAEKRNIVLRAVTADPLPEFYGDRGRMQQLFANLINNAIKYSPDGSEVVLAIAVEEGARFHITVSDHGIGIDKNEHKNIFDSFYEIGSANRHSTDPSKFMGGGSGLGLSIVKGIVERHGGKVWVESEGTKEGEFPGSVFHVLLPLRAEISWDDDESNMSEENRLKEADNIDINALDDEERGMPVILFISPDADSMEVANSAIENIFDILAAENGELGLAIAFDQKPSLILIDSHLSGLDGYRICKILRSQEETKNIPIALVSAAVKDEEIQQGFSCGADDFIVKPFTGSELMKKVSRLLMKKKEDEVFK